MNISLHSTLGSESLPILSGRESGSWLNTITTTSDNTKTNGSAMKSARVKHKYSTTHPHNSRLPSFYADANLLPVNNNSNITPLTSHLLIPEIFFPSGSWQLQCFRDRRFDSSDDNKKKRFIFSVIAFWIQMLMIMGPFWTAGHSVEKSDSQHPRDGCYKRPICY